MKSIVLKLLLLPISLVAQAGNMTVTGTATIVGSLIFSSAEAADENEDRLLAVSVTLMRPAKLKWKLGNFGDFTPGQRIYARVINLCRLGADTNNYWSALFSSNDPMQYAAIESSATITANGAQSVLCYVTETDVLGVSNAKRTYTRMMAYLARDAAIAHYQARRAGTGSGGAAKSVSTPTAITPGTHGSVVLYLEGQGYECDLNGTVSGVDYVMPALATKTAITTSAAADDWGHQWFGPVRLFLPIAASMDSQSFTWSIKAYTAQATYDGVANARVAELPSWWNDDAP